MLALPAVEIRRAVRMGLEEDLAQATSRQRHSFPNLPCPRQDHRPTIPRCCRDGAAIQSFIVVDSSLKLTPSRRDGSHAKRGCTIADRRRWTIHLNAERVALNFLQHLSGIATLTSRFCHAVMAIRSTLWIQERLSLAGSSSKMAVSLGGNESPSFARRCIFIKDNHLA